MSATIISTNNDPVVGLHSQIDQLKIQLGEYTKHDTQVTSFNGTPEYITNNQMNLYIPTLEPFFNYPPQLNICSRFLSLILISAIIFIIFVLLFRNR
jgi:hypothetical protein